MIGWDTLVVQHRGEFEMSEYLTKENLDTQQRRLLLR
jgi:hypothetical protein